MSQGLLLDPTGTESAGASDTAVAERPVLVALPQIGNADDNHATGESDIARRRPFQRRPGRQLKLVLLPRLTPEPDRTPPLAPMDLAEAFGGLGASLRPLEVQDLNFQDALLEPGDTVLLGPADTDRALTTGSLVALRVDGGALCLRRMRPEADGRLRLHCEDPDLPAEQVQASAVTVEGIVITVVRAPRRAN
jgi:hypothetical protein